MPLGLGVGLLGLGVGPLGLGGGCLLFMPLEYTCDCMTIYRSTVVM